ncbi:hypothetical protein [Candidatus Sororendozoicomonas aggregata]|uniref:hypothetical protein n=1 Tax=Candidatus Sororendozoicomonas aggregata TaxID=3073239 RepID=UPI002ED526B6
MSRETRIFQLSILAYILRHGELSDYDKKELADALDKIVSGEDARKAFGLIDYGRPSKFDRDHDIYCYVEELYETKNYSECYKEVAKKFGITESNAKRIYLKTRKDVEDIERSNH